MPLPGPVSIVAASPSSGFTAASASVSPARPASAALSGPSLGDANVPATFSGERSARMLMSFG